MSAALDYTIEEQTAVALIPSASLPTILAIEGAPDILQALADEYAAFKSDISTLKGRKAIATMADKISTAKMDVVRLANAKTENWRAWTKSIVSERKVLEDKMDALKAQVRAPLTEFENAEKARIAAHEAALAEIGAASLFDDDYPTSAEIDMRLADLSFFPARDWQEFAQRAQDAFSAASESLKGKLAVALKQEAEAAELARLRAEQAERNRLAAIREQAEREAQIAAQAAEQARLAAEAKAAEEAAEAARKAEEVAEAAKQEQRRVEAEAKAAKERAEKLAAEAEGNRVAGHVRALTSLRGMIADARSPFNGSDLIRHIVGIFDQMEEHRRDWEEFSGEYTETVEVGRREISERLASVIEQEVDRAEKSRIAADQKAEAERIAAIEAERQRVADEKEAERIAAERREANVAHRKRINNEALTDIVAALAHTDIDYNDGPDIGTQIAKAIISALAKSEIRHCAISY